MGGVKKEGRGLAPPHSKTSLATTGCEPRVNPLLLQGRPPVADAQWSVSEKVYNEPMRPRQKELIRWSPATHSASPVLEQGHPMPRVKVEGTSSPTVTPQPF